jgi:hypothetical protein
MQRIPIVCVTSLAILAAAGCLNGGDPAHPNTAAAAAAARSSEAADGAASAKRAAAGDVCALLGAAEVTEITGLPIDRVQRKPDGCEWYANAAAQQQKGTATARDTFKQLSAQEPKSTDEGVKSVENLFNGLRGAVDPGKPVFAVTVQRGDVDQAEALFKGTVAMNGGKVEPIEGLGDRAFAGPMGAFFYVRKGSALIMFAGIGTREQTIALARRIVPRIQ